MKEAYPLCWPSGYKRTPDHLKKRSQFKQTMDGAQRFLRDEIRRLCGNDLIVSTNLPLRKDGMLYTDWMNRKITDPGVAIYFKYKGKEISMCCDQYNTVWENIYALGKGIEALRGMDRWGVSEFMERAFTGFTAIPERIETRTCWQILDMQPTRDEDEIKRNYRSKSLIVHPDKPGGSATAFQELNKAYNEALDYSRA